MRGASKYNDFALEPRTKTFSHVFARPSEEFSGLLFTQLGLAKHALCWQKLSCWVQSCDSVDCEIKFLAVVVMSLFDLAKATVVCGGVSFLVYTFPAISQGVIIGLLTVVWLSYARTLIRKFVGR
jgi:hypothetical protein